ncbi:hypothetical protein KUH32_02200 [Thalassococcus sp. CAU 1522]|uniref:DUF3035 domain-containing protein n=1 Tax=Thalassococcus arenae TaxID=2851652 RepID=A0ABS6N3H5_9RHOB|nr:hypothetical protein [Thalassococcus arenae]MBV2358572.1 hypothetical protein [Thalassococcus arenae]
MRRLLVCLAVLSACAQFPELEDGGAPGVDDAPYPRLLPLETLLAEPPRRATEAGTAAVQGDAARLRARAEALRGVTVPRAAMQARAARLQARAEALKAAPL